MGNDYKKLVKYWEETADYDYKSMRSLFKSKRYISSLFFGHIVLEKILKALLVKKTKKQTPYTHDLVRLYKLTGVKQDKADKKLLLQVNDFNIRARYPEWKLRFYKICTRKYAQNYLNEIDNLYKKLCRKLKPKK
jgi:HEPN domain-containing protein